MGSDLPILATILLLGVGCGTAAAMIFKAKGRSPVVGLLLGLFLNLIGLLVAVVMPRKRSSAT